MFIGQQHEMQNVPNYRVIARRGKAPTWQSPGTMFAFALLADRLKQEIATSRCALLAMTFLVVQCNCPPNCNLPLPAEFVDRLALVMGAGLGERLGPFGMVDGVGVELGLQRNAGALAVIDTALAGFVQEIACVELDTGAVCMYRHGASGAGVTQNCAGIAEYLEIVVIAALQVQTFIVLADVAADGLGFAEIKGSSFNLAQLTGGDIGSVVGVKPAAGDDQLLMNGSVRILMTGQIEIAVVGHVEDRVPVCHGIICNVQSVVCFQRVGHADDRVSGKALIALGTVETQRDGVFSVPLYLPEAQMEPIRTAVQAVAAFVGVEPDSGVVQQKGCTCNAVGIAANDGAEVTAVAAAVAFCIVKTQNHIFQIALAVGHKQRHKMGAEIGNGGGQLAARYGVKRSLLAGYKCAERFFHKDSPSIFETKRGFLEILVFGIIILYFCFTFKPIFVSLRIFETFWRFVVNGKSEQKPNFLMDTNCSTIFCVLLLTKPQYLV